jgi:hypothetical protein
MSLTHSALHERKWGPFPGLRQALQDKEIPGKYYGVSSADDNEFDFMQRLMEISILVIAHEASIEELANAECCSVQCKDTCRDLCRLSDLLRDASFYFRDKADSVITIQRKLSSKIL